MSERERVLEQAGGQSPIIPILIDLQNALALIAGQAGNYSFELEEIITRAGHNIDALTTEANHE